MDYSKVSLTYEQQADQLLKRGLIADRDVMVERLIMVNYYRLSGYLYPFRGPDDNYEKGTTLEMVWRRYTFDRQLRFLVMDGIERVEVSVRSALVYEHAHHFGPFGYTVPAQLPNLSSADFGRLLTDIYRETDRSKEVFVRHFKKKYGDQHGWPPIWMAAELMTLGTTLSFFRGVPASIKTSVARRYNQPEEVFESWLRALNVTRNICAHHARLWNRVLGVSPKIPKKHKNPEWHTPETIVNDRAFAILTVLRYLLRTIAPQSQWPQRLQVLLNDYPDIPVEQMGFPSNWRQSPIWQEQGGENNAP